jgi:signal peptidase I
VPTQRVVKCVAVGLGLVALATAWRAAAPVGLGGSKLYFSVEGSSMEPGVRAGDLVVVDSDAAYGVGEIAAYESERLGHAVLHRIVGRSAGRFVFKGDNNRWVDQERPYADRLDGKLWLHVPGAGRWASLVAEGSHAAVGAGAFTLLVGIFLGSRMLRRGRHGAPRGPYAPTHLVSASRREPART